MSESLQDEVEIRKKIDNEVIGMLDSEYVTYTPGPRLLDVTFEELQDAQAIFSNVARYPYVEMAVAEGHKFANHMNGLFKTRGKEAGRKILGEVASISGAGVIVPRTTIDYINAESEIIPSVPSNDEEIFDNQMNEMTGLFRGVGFLVEVDEDAQVKGQDGEMLDCPYYIRLYYKLQIGAYHQPLGDVKMFSLGEIGVANLAFEQDAEQQAIYDALAQLLSNDSIEVAELVNDLNLVLAQSHQTAKDIREIGKLTKQLHASEYLRPEDSAAVLDLIIAYIPPFAPYSLAASTVLEYQAGQRDMEFAVVKDENTNTLNYDQPLTSIVLAPEYETDQNLENLNELVETGTVPYFVLERDDSVVYIPMNRVTSIGPGGY
jgi:hypothetical protein